MYKFLDPSSGPLLYTVFYPVHVSDGYKSLMPCSKHDGKGLQLPLHNAPWGRQDTWKYNWYLFSLLVRSGFLKLTILSSSSCHWRNWWHGNSQHWAQNHSSSGGSCSSPHSRLLGTSSSHYSFLPPLYCSFFVLSFATAFTPQLGRLQMETSLGTRFHTLFFGSHYHSEDAQVRFCFSSMFVCPSVF